MMLQCQSSNNQQRQTKKLHLTTLKCQSDMIAHQIHKSISSIELADTRHQKPVEGGIALGNLSNSKNKKTTTPQAKKSVASFIEQFKTPELKHKECVFTETKRLATVDVASSSEELYDLQLHADMLDIFRSPLRKFLSRLVAWKVGSGANIQRPFQSLHIYGGEAYRLYWEARIRNKLGAGPPFGALPPFRRPADIDVMIPVNNSRKWFDESFQATSKALICAFQTIFCLPKLRHELHAGAALAAQKGILNISGPFLNFRSSPYVYHIDPQSGESDFDHSKMYHTAIITLEGMYLSGYSTGPITLMEIQLRPATITQVTFPNDVLSCYLAGPNGATAARLQTLSNSLISQRRRRNSHQRQSGDWVLCVLNIEQMLKSAEKVIGNRHTTKKSKAKTDVNRFTWFKQHDWNSIISASCASCETLNDTNKICQLEKFDLTYASKVICQSSSFQQAQICPLGDLMNVLNTHSLESNTIPSNMLQKANYKKKKRRKSRRRRRRGNRIINSQKSSKN